MQVVRGGGGDGGGGGASVHPLHIQPQQHLHQDCCCFRGVWRLSGGQWIRH